MDSVFFFAIRFHVCSQFANGAIEFLSLMFPLRLFGRGIYIKRSSSLHLVLHILQVVAWFPISLMCLSDDCSAVNSIGGLGALWNYVFLFVKCSCAMSRATFFQLLSSCGGSSLFLQIFLSVPDNFARVMKFFALITDCFPMTMALCLTMHGASTV